MYVYMVLFALLSAGGAWIAWRRNPLYSTRSTLRSAAVVVLAVVALIAMIAAAVNLTIHRSPAVALGTLAAVIVFGSLALIFIVQTVSTPREAKLEMMLPPSAKLVDLHRQKVYKWAKLFALLLVICGSLAVVIPGNAKYVAGTLGGITLLLAAILLPVLYVTARNFDRSLTALECNPWVHWQYPPAQWRQWTDVQIERRKAMPPRFGLQRDWRSLAWTLALIGAAVLIFAPGSWLQKSLYVFLCCGAVGAIAVWSSWENQRAAGKLRSTLLAVAPEAYFGRDGVFCDGVYTAWLSLNVYLMSASIDERHPRSLLFRFEKVVPNPYGGKPVMPIQQSVLIPTGAESDIARLQQKLAARCPNAQIVLY